MKKKILFAAALAGLALPTASKAAIIVSLGSPSAGMTVAPGSTIEAVISGDTNNPNGIESIQGRIQESVNGGASAESSPFSASVVPTNPANTSSNQPIVDQFFQVTPFTSPAQQASLTQEVTPTTKFNASGQPTTVSGNEPLPSLVANTATNGPAFGMMFSPVPEQWVEVAYKIPATVPNGTVITFSLTTIGNGTSGNEYADQTGTISPVTEQLAGGFQVTVGTVPEPASLGLLGTAFGGLMLRRRK